jgi:hypothetical protein
MYDEYGGKKKTPPERKNKNKIKSAVLYMYVREVIFFDPFFNSDLHTTLSLSYLTFLTLVTN